MWCLSIIAEGCIYVDLTPDVFGIFDVNNFYTERIDFASLVFLEASAGRIGFIDSEFDRWITGM